MLEPMLICYHRVKTRLQVQVKRKPGEIASTTNDRHYESTGHAIKSIIEDEGYSGLYSGMVGSLIGVASTNFAYFYWYSTVRSVYLSRPSLPNPPGTATELALGAVAGALAQLFTIPIAVVTTRQQTQPKGDKRGMMDTAREVINSEDGWSGLWRGMKASLVLVVNPAITYGAYQRLRDVLYPGKTSLRPFEAFSKLLTSPLTGRVLMLRTSPGRAFQVACHDSHTATHCCQGRIAIEATSSSDGQTFQIVCRGHEVYHRKRRSAWAVQRHWASDSEGLPCTRHLDDDKGEDGISVCSSLQISAQGQSREAAKDRRLGCSAGKQGGTCYDEVVFDDCRIMGLAFMESLVNGIYSGWAILPITEQQAEITDADR